MPSLLHTSTRVEYAAGRSLQRHEDAYDADAAAEERGAAMAIERLTKLAQRAGNHISIGSPDRTRLFLVLFITDMRPVSPELANAIAAASGLTHWIEA